MSTTNVTIRSNSQVISAPVIVHTRLGHDKWVLQTLWYDQIHKWSLRPWLCKPDSSLEMRAVDAITRYQFPAANSHLISKPEIMNTRLAHAKCSSKFTADLHAWDYARQTRSWEIRNENRRHDATIIPEDKFTADLHARDCPHQTRSCETLTTTLLRDK